LIGLDPGRNGYTEVRNEKVTGRRYAHT
jgi:hypothetical protein